MRYVDVLAVAFRNLRRQKLRSALTIFAVVIGAASVTIMLALVTGAKGFFLSQVESSGQLQQIMVSQATDLDYEQARYAHSSDSGVKLTDALVGRIERIPHVTAVARTVSPSVFDALEYQGRKLSADNVMSSDANGVIVRSMLAGRDFDDAAGTGSLLVSRPYADKLGYAKKYDRLVGQQVTLITRGWYSGEGAALPTKNPGPGDEKQQRPTRLSAKIVGVVADEDTALYVPMAWARGLLVNRRYDMTDADRKAFEQAQRDSHAQGNGRPGAPAQPHFTLISRSEIDERGYNALTVKADRTSNVDGIAKAIRPLGVGAATAMSSVEQQLEIFRILAYVLGGIGGIALAVATIGVINTMVMSIMERTREIGVMRACGATRAAVRRLFTIEAGLLGFLGGLFGVGVGYGLTYVANLVINEQLSAGSIKAHDIIGLPLWLIAAVIVATTVIGRLAGLYPAFMAARLDPVEALRYE